MKKKKLALIIAACVLLAALAVTVMAYDSSEDPIISLSYLSDIFRPQILREVDSKIDTAIKNSGSGNTPVTPQPAESASSGYEVIEMKAGQVLYATDACDVMLRSGTAVCTAPDPKQGIADYTDATEILNGQPLVKNHMCLIPRGDGRGVVATSSSVFIMVRGTYFIGN